MEQLTPIYYSVVALSGEQNHRCAYCQLHMKLHFAEPVLHVSQLATRDHVMARSHGGSDDWENLVAACHICNSLKETMDAYWFAKFIARLFTWTKYREQWHTLTESEQSRVRKALKRSYRRYQLQQQVRYQRAIVR